MNETITYLIQYRANAHDNWKDDTMRYPTSAGAAARISKCKESRMFRSAEFRIIKRTDEVPS